MLARQDHALFEEERKENNAVFFAISSSESRFISCKLNSLDRGNRNEKVEADGEKSSTREYSRPSWTAICNAFWTLNWIAVDSSTEDSSDR